MKMNLENTLSVQNQIRENSEDLQIFLKDMDNWEKDMKKKEQELKLLQVTENEDVPPIRNSSSRSKKRNRLRKIKKQEIPIEERISSYDYKAWDKFDVDSELKKLDEEKKESSGSESTDSDERLTIQSNKQLALIKKDKGNDFFKNGNYDSAINCYTIGIELDRENALLPANRAMAFLKKEQFQAAENDCTLCISIDPSYVKAYLRRGTARKALEKYELAKGDFLKALELEPDNKQAHLELEKLSKNENDVKPTNQEKYSLEKEHTISKQSEILNNQIKERSNSSPQKSTSNFLECESSNNYRSVEKKVCSLFPEAEPITIVKCHQDLQEDLFTEIEITNQSHDDFKGMLEKEKHTSDHKLGNGSSSSNTAKIDGTLCAEIENVITALEKQLPPVPTASYQFLTDWKKLSKYPELKYQYLKQFPPEKFPVIFKNYMEPEIFPEILYVLSTFFIENGDDVFHYMKHLSSVGRFDTMLMFMADHEKTDLRKLLSYVERSGYSPSDVEAVLRLYKV